MIATPTTTTAGVDSRQEEMEQEEDNDDPDKEDIVGSGMASTHTHFLLFTYSHLGFLLFNLILNN